MRRVVVFCEVCLKVVTVVPELRRGDMTRLRLHFGRHRYVVTSGFARRHIRLTVKDDAA